MHAPSNFRMKMEATCISEKFLSYYITTLCHNTEDLDLNLYPSPTHFTLKMQAAWSPETLVS
jgi:hypothetical protein